MTNHIVEFHSVSKKFCKALEKQMFYGAIDIVKNTFRIDQNSESLRKDEFWALDDVSFNVEKGDAVGLVGINGSGKSTILKMINGIFMPDVGQIKIYGSVGSLIELGSGFHPYLTGKENIYLYGAILGMTKKYIDQRYDEIVEFSELKDFLDMPVKNYSSGMYVRLGFSIASHLQTDILLIDEVLAVGDFEFQKKCIEKINKLRREGTTIIFVSHNGENLKEICSKCVLLHHGKLLETGKTEQILYKYRNEF